MEIALLVVLAVGPTLLLFLLLDAIRSHLKAIRKLLAAASDLNLEAHDRLLKTIEKTP